MSSIGSRMPNSKLEHRFPLSQRFATNVWNVLIKTEVRYFKATFSKESILQLCKAGMLIWLLALVNGAFGEYHVLSQPSPPWGHLLTRRDMSGACLHPHGPNSEPNLAHKSGQNEKKRSQVFCCDESCSALRHIFPRFPGNIQIRKKCVSVSCLVLSNSLRPHVACQASLHTGFSRQEHWSGLPFPSPGNLPNPGIELRSPALQADSSPSEPPRKPPYKDELPFKSRKMIRLFPSHDQPGNFCCRVNQRRKGSLDAKTRPLSSSCFFSC